MDSRYRGLPRQASEVIGGNNMPYDPKDPLKDRITDIGPRY